MTMKNLKNILLVSLISAACVGQIAYADSALKLGSAQNVIHTTLIQVDQGSVDANVKLYVGSGDKNSCQGTRLLAELNGPFANGDRVGLDGDILARAIGVKYTCAKEVYAAQERAGSPVVVQYTLINNKKTYTAADPPQQQANLSELANKR
jgi:hypothetical protein